MRYHSLYAVVDGREPEYSDYEDCGWFSSSDQFFEPENLYRELPEEYAVGLEACISPLIPDDAEYVDVEITHSGSLTVGYLYSNGTLWDGFNTNLEPLPWFSELPLAEPSQPDSSKWLLFV